jgi:hypothetical protein
VYYPAVVKSRSWELGRLSSPGLWLAGLHITAAVLLEISPKTVQLYVEKYKALVSLLIKQFFFSSKRSLLYNPIISVDKVIIRAGNGIDKPQTGDKITVAFTCWLYDPDQAGRGKEYAMTLDVVMAILIAKMRFSNKKQDF